MRRISDPLVWLLTRGALALLLALPAMLAAQEAPRSPVLVVDFDEVFRLSERGQEILQELDSRSRELADEIARIDIEMAAEEKELTERRAGLSAIEFRKLADAFDAKVQAMRAAQDARAEALSRDQASARFEFRQTAFPILGQLMLDAGAVLVVEKRNVLVFNDAIDVSEITARRLDAAYAGRQPAEEAQPAEAAPETAPETDPEGAAPVAGGALVEDPDAAE
ncbi:OmpH family outer membrane protein [Marinovum sp.]|uniref:OmpH family outer membrane protein n=1 Tax=Marinovum sp. TaxID=2024839 RepID=UPI002B274DEA|nr:OmpH family outer membrane protein [Marinovum sp.]